MDFNYDKAPQSSHQSTEHVSKGISESTSTEVIRKKLEAELRAAEALGKVKQVIIEKRLAVELAVIEEEHKKKRLIGGTLRANFGYSSRVSDDDRMEMRIRRDTSHLKNKFLWAKKDSNSSTSSRFSAPNSFFKDDRHESRIETVIKDAFREPKNNRHKPIKQLFSRRDVPSRDGHTRRKRKDSPYSSRPHIEEEVPEVPEDIGEEDPEMDEEDPIESEPETQMQTKQKGLKEFFRKIRKNAREPIPFGKG